MLCALFQEVILVKFVCYVYWEYVVLVPYVVHPLPLRGTLFEPDVKLGSLTLIRHKMTLSHFS